MKSQLARNLQELTKSPKVDQASEEMDEESAETSAMEKGSVDGKQCKEGGDDRGRTPKKHIAKMPEFRTL